MPKPTGLSCEGYLEYCRNHATLGEVGDTTSSNSRYIWPTDNHLISAPPKEQSNPSHTEKNIKPLVAPSEENIDPPVVDKFNNKPRRIDDDLCYDSRDDEEPTPEVLEDSSTDTEDEGEGLNKVQGPFLNEPNNGSHEDDDHTYI